MIVDKYADIIDLPHHVSTVHPQMSMLSRAAQFAPFSALNGHSDAIAATALRNEQDYVPEDYDEQDYVPEDYDKQDYAPEDYDKQDYAPED